ncbi:hypothetical protein NliqN6_6475 [Naganishia liquefaciens]|uniref:Integrase catalytic domain-containing protein n=1 Tax=Naganishia liquefaciens TaxID=104408 RepID=A0A8H3TZQ9_9TREE|nr:hypothetical protein NliqN6_6475 [Naganishia liquefaciens]
MSSTSNLLQDIPILTGAENAFQWEIDIMNLLMTIGADGIVDGTEAKPSVTPLALAEGGKKPETAALSLFQYEMKRADDWEKRNREAKGYMLKTVSKSLRHDLRDCKTAKEIWDRLKLLHKIQRPELRNQAMRELLSFRFRPGDDPNKHVDAFTDLVFKAKAAGEGIDDGRRCELFIDTLPKEYDTVQTRFLTMKEEERTFAYLKTLFHDQSTRLEREQKSDLLYTQGKRSFYDKKRNDGKGAGQRNKSSDECFYCHKKDHHKNKCRKRIRDEKNGNGKSNTRSEQAAYLGTGFTASAIGTIDLQQVGSQIFHAQHSDNTIRFLLDLGATEHICGDRSAFTNLRKAAVPRTFQTVSGVTRAEEVGDIVVVGSHAGNLTITDVYHIPGCPNLLSYGLMIKRKWDIRVTEDGGVMRVGGLKGLMYHLRTTGTQGALRLVEFSLLNKRPDSGIATAAEATVATAFITATHTKDTLEQWHQRLGHKGVSGIRELAKIGLIEITDDNNTTFRTDQCDTCAISKTARQSFSDVSVRGSKPLELVHSDIAGPFVPGEKGYKYYITFIDDYTGTLTALPMTDKTVNSTFSHFLNFKATMEKGWNSPIKIFRTDGGSEYKRRFGIFLNRNGINN